MGVWSSGSATAGNDTFTGDGTAETANGLAGDDTLHGGGGNDSLDGGPGGDLLFGEDGDDTLTVRDGEEGDDALVDGGGGTDTLLLVGEVDLYNMGVTSIEKISFASAFDFHRGLFQSNQLGAGLSNTLAVRGSVGAKPDGVEVFTSGVGDTIDLSGWTFTNWNQVNEDYVAIYGDAGANTLIGTSVRDRLDGGDGADTLYGGDGDDEFYPGPSGSSDGDADTMYGGAGNDAYGVFDATDTVVELVGQGTDRIAAWIDHAMESNVENMTLYGTAVVGTGNTLANSIEGNELNNTLSGGNGDDYVFGGDGNDVINGNAGADEMVGGLGDDTFYVDNAGDSVNDNFDAGLDSVRASISCTLTNNVENLTLTGTSNINGTGNALNNRIVGNSGANTLDGGIGVDSLIGGDGNDTYVIDVSGDTISDTSGVDTVISSVNWTLAGPLENLTLVGDAINAYGNAADNVLTGNINNNGLVGGAGADTMLGGLGNDIYYVDNVGDVTAESADAGVDTVRSEVSRSLGANLENLTLMGSANINGSGNALNNKLIGNSGNNVLNGALGNDQLTGGAGADSFVFSYTPGATNRDAIMDFNVADDTIRLDDAIYAALGAPGVLAAGAFSTGAAATEADDRIIYNSATGALFYDADGNGAGAVVQFAQMTSGLALTSADFLVV